MPFGNKIYSAIHIEHRNRVAYGKLALIIIICVYNSRSSGKQPVCIPNKSEPADCIEIKIMTFKKQILAFERFSLCKLITYGRRQRYGAKKIRRKNPIISISEIYAVVIIIYFIERKYTMVLLDEYRQQLTAAIAALKQAGESL